MYCKECGKEIAANSKFCQLCGCQQEEPPATTQSQINIETVDIQSQPLDDNPKPKKNKRKKTIIIIALVIFYGVSLFGSALLGFCLGGTEEQSNTSSTSQKPAILTTVPNNYIYNGKLISLQAVDAYKYKYGDEYWLSVLVILNLTDFSDEEIKNFVEDEDACKIFLYKDDKVYEELIHKDTEIDGTFVVFTYRTNSCVSLADFKNFTAAINTKNVFYVFMRNEVPPDMPTEN